MSNSLLTKITRLVQQIEALTAERDGLESDYLRRHKDACDRAEEIAALKAERDALAKDAQRYRFLVDDPIEWDEGEGTHAYILIHGDKTWRGPSLDAAIDQAISAKEGV